MKKALIVLTVVVALFFCLFALGSADAGKEKAAIEQATRDYIEGWYEGSAERMDNALHPDLTKKGVQIFLKTGGTMISMATKTNMVEYTRAGLGKNLEKKQKIEVIILDIFKNTASVKTVSPDFIDYIHLVKWNGEWKIINVLWEMNK